VTETSTLIAAYSSSDIYRKNIRAFSGMSRLSNNPILSLVLYASQRFDALSMNEIQEYEKRYGQRLLLATCQTSKIGRQLVRYLQEEQVKFSGIGGWTISSGRGGSRV
jgi:DNA-binding LacI/PurR family transcriptional regulator